MRLALDAFWLLPIPVLAAIVVAMYRRKQHISYPIFWAFALFECLRLVIEFICNLISYKAYFYSYWAASFVSVLLILLLLRTVFVRFLEKYPALNGVRRHGFEFAISVIWFTALALNIGFMRDQDWPHRITRIELILGFTQVGVFIFVLVTTLVLGIRWKSTYSGIAAGLGLLGASDLLVYTGLSWASFLSAPAVVGSWIETVAYDIAIAIFAFHFLPMSADQQVQADLRPELLDWAESMKGAVRK